MAGYEQTIIVGNVGRDPETKYLANSGSSVTTFSVAVTRKWRDKASQELREATNWYRVNCWGSQGENAAKLIKKGQQVMITGTVTANGYTSQAGEVRASLELRCDNFQLLGSRGDNAGGAPSGDDNYGGDYSNARSGGNGGGDSDIPF